MTNKPSQPSRESEEGEEEKINLKLKEIERETKHFAPFPWRPLAELSAYERPEYLTQAKNYRKMGGEN